MVIKLAVVGSCLTRDNFNSYFNPYYKKFFNVVATQNQGTFPSLMSESIELTVSNRFLEKMDYVKKLTLGEFDKSFLEIVKKEQPEYILIDLNSDVKFGVIKFTDKRFVTDNVNYKDLPEVEGLERINITENFDEYFELWKASIHKFFDFVKEHLPNTKVVLVSGRYEDEFTDGTSYTNYRKENNYSVQDYESMNKTWDFLENYITDNFNVLLLNIEQEKYKLDKNHRWGRYHLHFEPKFYNDFLNNLIKMLYIDNGIDFEGLNRPIQRIYLDSELDILNTKVVEVNTNSERNLIQIARKDERAYNVYKELLKNDYILYYHTEGVSKLYKREHVNELWKRDDLQKEGDVYYTVDEPIDRKLNTMSDEKKLIVIFPCMPEGSVYDHYLMTNRMFTKFFNGIERSLVKNVYTMRIMDLNLSHGSHFVNSVNNNTMETDISNAILSVIDELGITKDDVVLYGASKGGTGSLYYGAKLDLKCLAVDPIISLGYYNIKDEHFLKGLRKEVLTDDINASLASKSSREKYIIGSENVKFNYSFIKQINGDNLTIINKKDNHITEHAEVSRNTIPEQLMLLNKMLLNR